MTKICSYVYMGAKNDHQLLVLPKTVLNSSSKTVEVSVPYYAAPESYM